MPAPITTDGPHYTRRHRRERLVLLMLAGALLGMPFLAAAIAGLTGG